MGAPMSRACARVPISSVPVTFLLALVRRGSRDGNPPRDIKPRRLEIEAALAAKQAVSEKYRERQQDKERGKGERGVEVRLHRGYDG